MMAFGFWGKRTGLSMTVFREIPYLIELMKNDTSIEETKTFTNIPRFSIMKE